MKSDFEKELELAALSVVEKGRSKLYGPPSREELLAYHNGGLPEDEAEEMRERLAHYPESVRMLADLTRDPDETSSAEILSPVELEQDWRAIEDRLMPATESSRSVRLGPLTKIAAALLLVVFGIAAHAAWIELGQGSNRIPLIPDGSRGGTGGGSPIILRLDDRAVELQPSLFDSPSFKSYRAVISEHRDTSADKWTRHGLVLEDGDIFSLPLPSDCRTPGLYRLSLYGVDESGEHLLATYTFDIPAF